MLGPLNQFSPAGNALAFGIIACVVGCFLLVTGLTDRDAAKHEATTPGIIVGIQHGRGGPYYDYEFRVNGIKMNDSGGDCKTPLDPQGCSVGGHVLVYYTFQPSNNSRLEDFAEGAREKLGWATGLSVVGVLLIGLSFLLRKLGYSDSSDNSDYTPQDESSEMPSIAPRD
jgi:uncharacterized protein DUF3592